MKIGPYEVERELGRGGVGVVYAGRDPRGAPVALKLLLGSARPDTLARFERERRLLAGLGQAEGFVPLLDAGAGPSGPYLVMPLVSGGTLRDRLERGSLDPEEAVAILRAVAEAMGRAHALGVVHRDLKPENILFAEDGRPLVADLGLGKHFDRSAPGASASVALSRTGELRGTACYMSPEQAADAKSAGPPADVFALGAILYECVSGFSPFAAENLVAVFHKLAHHELEPLEKVCPGAPRWLVAVVRRALAQDPQRRFPDGASLARALAKGGSRGRGARVAIAFLVAAPLLGASGWVVASTRHARAEAERRAGEARRQEEDRSRAERAREIASVQSLLARGAKPPSLEVARRATELVPGSARAWILRAVAARERRLADEAMAAAEKAVSLAPDAASSYAGRGWERFHRDDLAGALADFERAVALDPRSTEALFGQGAVFSLRGEYPRALEAFTRGLEIDGSDLAARLARGVARERTRDVAGALADFDAVLTVQPRHVEALFDRGGARAQSGDLAGAIADFDDVLAIDRDHFPALRARAIAQATRGNLRAAIADFDRAIALRPTDPACVSGRGDAREQIDDLDGAIADDTRWIELEPERAAAHLQRAFARSRKGDLRLAIEDYTRGLALEPRNVTALLNRAMARGSLDGFAAALGDLDAALSLAPDNAEARRLRAQARAGAGDAKGAIEDYRRLLELAPGDPRAAEIQAEIARLGGR